MVVVDDVVGEVVVLVVELGGGDVVGDEVELGGVVVLLGGCVVEDGGSVVLLVVAGGCEVVDGPELVEGTADVDGSVSGRSGIDHCGAGGCRCASLHRQDELTIAPCLTCQEAVWRRRGNVHPHCCLLALRSDTVVATAFTRLITVVIFSVASELMKGNRMEGLSEMHGMIC